MAKPDAPTLAIYIHWPFCTKICPYCDFNVYKNRTDDALIPAILTDLTAWRHWSGARQITSVHFGGGTPSLMSPEQVSQILSHIHILWGLNLNTTHTTPSGSETRVPVDVAVEIAMEANPSDYDPIKWQAYRQAGLNRLSLGVQSFEDNTLAVLGRDHDSKAAKRALAGGRDIFPSLSLDLIFGQYGQSRKALVSDLKTALAYNPDHISTYQLTIEHGTAFFKAEARGDRRAVSPEKSADYFDIICQKLQLAGYSHYEVSNFAKPAHQSRHNLTYWTGGDYAGIGPGAHGRLTYDGQRFATIAHKHPKTYSQARDNGSAHTATRYPFGQKTRLSPQEWADEYILMGLRIKDGISMARYETLSGQPLPSHIVSDFIEAGWLALKNDALNATSKGQLVLNYLTQKLLGG